MYSITVDVTEDLSGWRVAWSVRLGSGRKVITLLDERWYCDSPFEDRMRIHAQLQAVSQDSAATIAEALLRVVCEDCNSVVKASNGGRRGGRE
jgi:hypothetical protein